MGGHLFVCNLSRPSLVRPLTPHLYKPIKRYGQVSKDDHHERVTEVKAPSLADEFQRVAEEKAKAAEKDARVADQGVASQTAAKAFDGTEEAVSFHGDVEATKEKYKDHEPGSDYRRRGN